MKTLSVLLLTSISFMTSAATSVDLVKDTKSWNGDSLPSQTIAQPEVTIKEITIQPGEALPIHLHPVINAGILLEGELTVYTEDRSKVLKLNADSEKNTIIEMVNQYHFGMNSGDKPAKIVVFYIAEKGHTVTKEKK
ncbi:hypothetical protein GCM10007938_24950 [Vibrio zhanjiangensis]|uniref:Cupin domain-containing protein n=1 Tax=Vibrio zhanjiangensis TaxID=1046128 RepID=A0ABQ6F0D6_9VIBR|nr:cupin domain-containing protein [Vibrio zhanjiangensis]GLT18714.1 hypothetical protein GCM10007938_24950 [Vibrio zhanjiangensis]